MKEETQYTITEAVAHLHSGGAIEIDANKDLIRQIINEAYGDKYPVKIFIIKLFLCGIDRNRYVLSDETNRPIIKLSQIAESQPTEKAKFQCCGIFPTNDCEPCGYYKQHNPATPQDLLDEMQYKGYDIMLSEFRRDGYPESNYVFFNTKDCDAFLGGNGFSIEDCKRQIDEAEDLFENAVINTDNPRKNAVIEESVIDFYNENIDSSNIPREHYEREIQRLMVDFAMFWQNKQAKQTEFDNERLESYIYEFAFECGKLWNTELTPDQKLKRIGEKMQLPEEMAKQYVRLSP